MDRRVDHLRQERKVVAVRHGTVAELTGKLVEECHAVWRKEPVTTAVMVSGHNHRRALPAKREHRVGVRLRELPCGMRRLDGRIVENVASDDQKVKVATRSSFLAKRFEHRVERRLYASRSEVKVRKVGNAAHRSR
jgi:hypothetical protein